jgi:hypothetical protein
LIKSYKYEHQNGGTMRRQKWGVIGLAAMLGIAALGCGEKKTEQDNGTDNPATVINWQEETKDTPDGAGNAAAGTAETGKMGIERPL